MTEPQNVSLATLNAVYSEAFVSCNLRIIAGGVLGAVASAPVTAIAGVAFACQTGEASDALAYMRSNGDLAMVASGLFTAAGTALYEVYHTAKNFASADFKLSNMLTLADTSISDKEWPTRVRHVNRALLPLAVLGGLGSVWINSLSYQQNLNDMTQQQNNTSLSRPVLRQGQSAVVQVKSDSVLLCL